MMVEVGSAGCDTDQVYPWWYLAGTLQLADMSAEAPADSIPDHGDAHPAADRIGHLHGRVGITGEVANGERTAPHSPTVSTQRIERGSVSNRANQADNRARPLRRRAFTTARPARSAIRCRNPCRLERLRTFGW
jgi:hypothetical protein